MMKKRFDKFQNFPYRCVSILFLLILLLGVFGFDQNRGDLSEHLKEKLKEVINKKTEHFFDRIQLRKQYQHHIIEHLDQEIKLRKDEGFTLDLSQFDMIFQVDNNWANQYEEEISKIIELIDQFNELERTAQFREDSTLISKIRTLKSRLEKVIGITDSEISKIYTDKIAQQLLKDYNKELDRLISIIYQLRKLKALDPYSSSLESDIEQFEKRLGNVLSGSCFSSEPLIDDYIQEHIKVVDILRELDEMDRRIPGEDLENHLEIRRIKDRILRVMDRDALASLGYRQIEYSADQKRLETYFEEWKAKQLLWYRAREKQIEILKERLIANGTRDQNRRLFRADVQLAISQFNNGNFELAEMIFKDVLAHYPYQNMDDLKYYLAECYYMQHKYTSAMKLYKIIIAQNSNTEFVKKAYWRLMLTSESFDQFQNFFDYSNEFIQRFGTESQDKLLDKVIFYSGYTALRREKFDQSIQLLNKIPTNSPYYLKGQFLIAVNHLNLNNPHKALPIFTHLCKRESYPHYDETARELRNQALLKTGLIYYQQNELVRALQILTQIPHGSINYDQTLLAKAWVCFRLGRLQEANDNLDLLFWNYIDSKYSYEAMMLSAHCDRLLRNVKSSTRKVRYVENADTVRHINDEMNAERYKIKQLLGEIERLEEKIATAGDIYAYQKTVRLRWELKLLLESMAYKGDPGLQLIQAYDEEQEHLLELIRDYQDLYKIANALGRNDLKKNIRETISKLSEKLVDFHKFQNFERVNILSDYPLARKESNLLFEKQQLQTMKKQIQVEEEKLASNRKLIASLLKKARETNHSEFTSQLDYRKMELNHLKDQLEQFRGSLSENEVTLLNTTFQEWSDFSGFGMSDLDFVRARSIDKKIDRYNDHIALVRSALENREKEIVQKIAQLDQKIEELKKDAHKKKIANQKAEREQYFNEEYFIDRTSEIENQKEHKTEKSDMQEKSSAAPDTLNIEK